MSRNLDFQPASPDQAEHLAELRVAAMHPSLVALGRFDPDRARDRFLSGFVPEDTIVISEYGEVTGFYVSRERTDHLYLDHLYVAERFQGRGIGALVMDRAKRQAQELGLPIRLMALKGSAANRFYCAEGFRLTHVEEFDNCYEWIPHQA